MKKILCLLLALCCAIPCFFATSAFADSTIYIGSFSELEAFSARVNEGDSMEGMRVELSADINLSGKHIPIGASSSTPFAGTFDGNGYEIYGLSVFGGDFAALFGCVSGGIVKNVTVKGSVRGDNYCALVVGRLYAYSYGSFAAVENCKAVGTVEGDSYVGGVVGYSAANANSAASGVTAKNCNFEGSVTGDMYVGGVVGKSEAFGGTYSAENIMESCLALASVKATGNVGSIAGGVVGGVYAKDNAFVVIRSCVADCSVSATLLAVGGIAGACGAENGTLVLENCGAYGIAAAPTVGGISADCGVEGVSVKDCISDITLVGDEISIIAHGANIENCFAPDCGIEEEGTSLLSHGALPSHSLYESPKRYKCGDVNGDGKVTPLDASLILQYNAALCTLGSSAFYAADANSDGKISPLDASLVLQYNAMLVMELPLIKE